MAGRAAVTESAETSGDEASSGGAAVHEMCRCVPEVVPSATGDIVVLRIDGEIDLLSLPVVRSAIAESVRRRPVDLVVDLAGLNFCCARGLDLLVTSGTTAARHGVGYSVSGLPAHLSHIWALLWTDEFPPCHPTAAMGVITIQASWAGSVQLG
ncbi:MAG: STAS domain-containing protein [Pseudonocardia sp.]